MTTTVTEEPTDPPELAPPAKASAWSAFKALLHRDMRVLDKDLKEFLPNTLMQPIMLVFTLTYVFPKIGQGVGGSTNAGRFSTILLGGMVAQSIIFNGIFRVALPMAREFDITSELEDRVLAPTSISTIAMEKVASGALQGFFAGLIVFPVAAFLPATPIYLRADWLVLATVTVLACITSAAIGLTVGSRVDPRLVPQITGFVALPLAFLGCIFYTWDSLNSVMWLKWLVLLNPLVYMSEGFRAGLSIGLPHMPYPGIYAGLIVSCALFTFLGVKGFRKRVLT
ncbi:MAG: ABC transporter permease [Actinomycetota bacterium]|nr:ABC transporter permease [Actinomycetota bacterium]